MKKKKKSVAMSNDTVLNDLNSNTGEHARTTIQYTGTYFTFTEKIFHQNAELHDAAALAGMSMVIQNISLTL